MARDGTGGRRHPPSLPPPGTRMAQSTAEVRTARRRLRRLRSDLDPRERADAERAIRRTLERLHVFRGAHAWRSTCRWRAKWTCVPLFMRRGGAAPRCSCRASRAGDAPDGVRALDTWDRAATQRVWHRRTSEHAPAASASISTSSCCRWSASTAAATDSAWCGLLRPGAKTAARSRAVLAATATRRRRVRLPGTRRDRGVALGRAARPDRHRAWRRRPRSSPGSGAHQMNYWLFKSEPDTFSVDDLARARRSTSPWDGVRNYQARNMMRDQMKVGDLGFFYHSSCDVPGIAGIVRIVRAGYRSAPRSIRRVATSTPRATRRRLAGTASTSARAEDRAADHARNAAQTCARSAREMVLLRRATDCR